MEIWKKIKGFKDYEVSNFGKIRSLDRVVVFKNGRKQFYKGKILKQNKHNLGYRDIKIYKKGKAIRFYTHRLVYFTFKGGNKKLQINHIDGNKSNNKLENLELCTGSHNIKHAFKSKLKLPTKGEDIHCSVLTEKLVKKFRKLNRQGKSIYSIAKDYKFNYSTVSDAVRKKTWKHIKD